MVMVRLFCCAQSYDLTNRTRTHLRAYNPASPTLSTRPFAQAFYIKLGALLVKQVRSAAALSAAPPPRAAAPPARRPERGAAAPPSQRSLTVGPRLPLRQVSKPLAAQFKRIATESPLLRPRVIRLGQAMHESSVALTNALKADEGVARTNRAFAGKLDDDGAARWGWGGGGPTCPRPVSACARLAARSGARPWARRSAAEEGGGLPWGGAHFLGADSGQRTADRGQRTASCGLRTAPLLTVPPHPAHPRPPAQIAGIAIAYEVNLSSQKEAKKAEAAAAEKAELRQARASSECLLQVCFSFFPGLSARRRRVRSSAL